VSLANLAIPPEREGDLAGLWSADLAVRLEQEGDGEFLAPHVGFKYNETRVSVLIGQCSIFILPLCSFVVN
jgi:hypothetical protein